LSSFGSDTYGERAISSSEAILVEKRVVTWKQAMASGTYVHVIAVTPATVGEFLKRRISSEEAIDRVNRGVIDYRASNTFHRYVN